MINIVKTFLNENLIIYLAWFQETKIIRSALVLFFGVLFSSACYAHGSFLGKNIYLEDIESDFLPYLNEEGKIDIQSMVLFLSESIGIHYFDASKTGFLTWAKSGLASRCFIPDRKRESVLRLEGITKKSISNGMTPEQYLSYLSIGFGNGDAPKAKDYMISLFTNLNYIYNLRTSGVENDKYRNAFFAHRESIAYRKIINYLYSRYSYYNEPKLSDIYLSEQQHAQFLMEIFSSADHLESYLKNIGLDERIAETLKNQWHGYKEKTLGITYYYGIEALLRHKVKSRLNPSHIYRGEPLYVWGKILELNPGFDLRFDLNFNEIFNFINVLGSFPPGEAYRSVIDNPNAPFIDQSQQLTGDDVLEFMVALGNILPNSPEGNFVDLIPAHDVENMKPKNPDDFENAEFEYFSLVIPEIYERIIGH